MKYKGRRGSGNVFDRRGSSGGGRGLAVGGGIGGLIIAVIVMFLGGDPSAVLDTGGGGMGGGQMETTGGPGIQQTGDAQEDDLAELVDVTLADTQDVWNKLMKANGMQYDEPQLILFSGSTQSGCGFASAATGPFYCPADERVYIDLSFYETMRDRFGATGDFAMAYVVAHEVGHHVQQELGLTTKVHGQRGRVSQKEYNQLQVRLELQADYFAGVWAHHAQRMFNSLEEGDIQEALNAANAIGDDRLQKQSQGRVVPDSFTHGTSEQRMRWFSKGLRSGDPAGGNTFELAYSQL